MSTAEFRDPDLIPLSFPADLPDLQSLPLSTILIGQDGRIRKARSLPQTIIEPGMPVEAVLSISYPALSAAAQSDMPPSLPAILSTTSGPMHVLAQPFLIAGGILVVVTRLSGVQEAEESRFERTPYGIVRLGLDGVVIFANAAGRRLWSDIELIGEPFAELLPESFRAEFLDKLRDVLATRSSRSIKLTSGAAVMIGNQAVHSEPRLTLLPEFLTKDTLRGVQVVIREGVLNALRIALREAALDTPQTVSSEAPDAMPVGNWQDRTRRMLDLLREALPHDLAIISEVSKNGKWMRPILMHPQPTEPWPRMWWRTSKEEQDKLSAAPYREELQEWLARNPDRKDEPLLKLLQEIKPGGEPLESFAVVPIRPQGRTEAVLSLASTLPKRFRFDPADPAATQDDDEEELPRDPLAVLNLLGLDALIVTMLQRAKLEERAEEKALVESIERAETVPEAASVLLGELVTRFGWDHAAVFIAHRPDALERDDSIRPEHQADPAEVLRPFVQYPETERGARHPLAIASDYVQPLYDPKPGEEFDEARALESGMLGAAIRSARRGESGILVASDVTSRDDAGRPPHWFRSISKQQRSALTIALTINGRTRWVLDTVSRQPNAFIEEDGDRVAPLVRSLAKRIAELRQNKLNRRLVDLMDKAVVITDDAGQILLTNSRARELLGLPHQSELGGLQVYKTDDCNLSDFVHGCDLPDGRTPEATLCMGPRNGQGVETRVRRVEDVTRTSDIIWLLDGADRETYTVDTKFIAETVQEVARQVRAPLLLAATLAKQLGRGQLQDAIAPTAQRVSEGIAKADLTFERLAEARGAMRAPKREERIVQLDALLGDIIEKLPDGDRGRLRVDAAGDVAVSGDRDRLTYALRTLLDHMLSRDGNPVSIRLRGLGPEASIELSGADIERLSASGDAALARALDAAADAQQSVRSILSAHGGELERTAAGFQLHVPLAHAREAQP